MKRKNKKLRIKDDSDFRGPSQLKKVLMAPLWPFIYVRNMVKHWGPLGAIKQLGLSVVRMFKWLIFGPQKGTSHRSVQSEAHLDWPSRKSFQNPIAWFGWLGLGAVRYVTTRSFRSFVLAIPALAFCISFLACASWGNKKSFDNFEGRYSIRLASAVQEEDLETARIAGDRLVASYPEKVEHRLTRALVEHEVGDGDWAVEMMRDIANYDNSPTAAMWLASQAGDRSKLREWPIERIREYCDWLTQASLNAPKDPRPILELSQVLDSFDDKRLAYQVLSKLADTDPRVGYRAVQLETQLGLRGRAMSRAKPLVEYLQKRLLSQPKDLMLRYRVGELLLLIGRSQDALATLQDGRLHAENENQQKFLDQAIVKALGYEIQRETRMVGTPADVMRKFRLIEEAQETYPNHPLIGPMITEVCIESYEHENDRDVIAQRNRQFANLTPDQIRFIEGTAALKVGRIDTAKALLDVPDEGSEQTPGQLNNLAFAIMQDKDGDLAEALELSNKAIKAAPGHPYLRDTRGQILTRMGRYREAISDFQLAWLADELRPEIAPTLLKCFDELDMTEEAALLRKAMGQPAAPKQPAKQSTNAANG
ncbi:MAG TPA: hypothetical protein DDW52_03860 [Planctomycetaceae bacterium]|nr:hypothetical protein [Planctomycetaceae bacterium]